MFENLYDIHDCHNGCCPGGQSHEDWGYSAACWDMLYGQLTCGVPNAHPQPAEDTDSNLTTPITSMRLLIFLIPVPQIVYSSVESQEHFFLLVCVIFSHIFCIQLLIRLSCYIHDLPF
jgi:hypothetical protein